MNFWYYWHIFLLIPGTSQFQEFFWTMMETHFWFWLSTFQLKILIKAICHMIHETHLWRTWDKSKLLISYFLLDTILHSYLEVFLHQSSPILSTRVAKSSFVTWEHQLELGKMRKELEEEERLLKCSKNESRFLDRFFFQNFHIIRFSCFPFFYLY